MKAKLFYENNYINLEDSINRWLDSNPLIKILNVTQSQEAGWRDFTGVAVITIWYERPKD